MSKYIEKLVQENMLEGIINTYDIVIIINQTWYDLLFTYNLLLLLISHHSVCVHI